MTGAGVGTGGGVGPWLGAIGCGVGAGVGAAVGDGVGTGEGATTTVGAAVGETGAAVGLGDGFGAAPVPHSQTLTKFGRNGHCSSGTCPSIPACSNSPHWTSGCPSNIKIAFGLPTQRPSPQTEHPLDGTAGQLPATAGIGAADVGGNIGAMVGAEATGAGGVVTIA